MKRFFCLLLLAATTLTAKADCFGHICLNVSIESFFITNTGDIYVATGGDESVLDCTALQGTYLKLDTTDAGAKNLYSALLTAQATSRNVNIRTETGSAGCRILYIDLPKPAQ